MDSTDIAATSSPVDDDVVAAATAKARAARTVMEAFEGTAKALQQFGIERIRVRGLSEDCTASGTSDEDDGAERLCEDGVREISEQQFMREFMFHSRPCIILGAVEDWPAMTKWRDDRYLFDLDHKLPLEDIISTASDSGEEDSEDDKEDEKKDEKDDEVRREIDGVKAGTAAEPRPRGPKRITVALTPNGRADAVTHVLYDTKDVPESARDDVFAGPQAQKEAVLLAHHDGLAEGDVMNASDGEAAGSTLKGEKLFMYAAEVKVTLPELYTLLQRSPMEPLPTPDSIDMRTYKQDAHVPVVAYSQLQNNCLNTEYQHLHADLRRNVEKFGNRVFGGVPEAANVWLGIPTSVSSMHQDWVENLYSVVRGVKEFTLLPPWEGIFVPKPEIPSAAFELDETRTDRDALHFAFKPYPAKDGTRVPWMNFDITPSQVEAENGAASVLKTLSDTIDDNEARKAKIMATSLLFGGDNEDAENQTQKRQGGEVDRFAAKKPKEVHPLVAHVHPGETLYLPSMWLHRVSQRADLHDIRARANHKVKAMRKSATGAEEAKEGGKRDEMAPPLPLIAAVNYWYDMSFTNPAVVMLKEFGLLL